MLGYMSGWMDGCDDHGPHVVLIPLGCHDVRPEHML